MVVVSILLVVESSGRSKEQRFFIQIILCISHLIDISSSHMNVFKVECGTNEKQCGLRFCG